MSWRRIGLNASYVLISTAALALLQWFIMAMIARWDGSAALGEYALSQALVMPASYLAWLALRPQLIVSRMGDTPPADLVFLRMVGPLLVLVPLFGLVAIVYRS